MRKPFLAAAFTSAGVLSLLLVGQTPAQFQPGQAYRQPQFGGNFQGSVLSPYLFLNRPGLTPTQNYFSLVQPQLAYDSQITQQQNQIQTNQAGLAGLAQQQAALGGPSITGQRPRFLSYQQYFLNLNAVASQTGTTGSTGPGGGGGGGGGLGSRTGGGTSQGQGVAGAGTGGVGR
jgi:hypothetical protein